MHTQDLTTPKGNFFFWCVAMKKATAAAAAALWRQALARREKSYGITIYYIFFLLSKCVKSLCSLGWCVCVRSDVDAGLKMPVPPSFHHFVMIHGEWEQEKASFVCVWMHTCWCQFLNITHNLHGNSKKMHFSSLTLFFSYINLNSLFCKRPPYTL